MCLNMGMKTFKYRHSKTHIKHMPYYRLLTVYGEIIVGPWFLEGWLPSLRGTSAKIRGPTMTSPYTFSIHIITYLIT